MTVEKALSELIKSEDFKAAARQDSRLRVYLGRITNRTLKTGAAIDLLVEFGYVVTISKPKKTVQVKKAKQ